MREKTTHLQTKIGNFDSRFGWSRRIGSDGRPVYSIWKCNKGKRYLIRAWTIASDRWNIAKELKCCRAVLNRYVHHIDEQSLLLSCTQVDQIKVSRFIKGKTEFESDKVGKKSDEYFSKWLGRLFKELKSLGFSDKKIEYALNDNIDWLRRCCESLLEIDTVADEFIKGEEARKIYREKLNSIAVD